MNFLLVLLLLRMVAVVMGLIGVFTEDVTAGLFAIVLLMVADSLERQERERLEVRRP